MMAGLSQLYSVSSAVQATHPERLLSAVDEWQDLGRGLGLCQEL